MQRFIICCRKRLLLHNLRLDQTFRGLGDAEAASW